MTAPLAAIRGRIAGPPARRIAYYSLAQTAYAGLAGAFEMPMALRLAGRLELVAAVYALYYTALLAGFIAGMLTVAGGRASLVFRIQLSLQAGLCLLAAALFPRLQGIGPLVAYFAVRGTAEGLYWSARHRSILWAVKDAGRDDFALRLQSLALLVGVLAPLVSGTAVSFLGPLARAGNPVLPAGYASVFLATGLVLLLVLGLSPSIEIGRGPISPRRVASIGRIPGTAPWRAWMTLVSFASVCAGVGSAVLNFGILKTEFGVGALGAGMALLSGLYFSLLRRWIAAHPEARGRNRLLGARLGTFSDAVSRLGYALFPLPAVLGAKALLDSFAVPLKSLFGDNLVRSEVERISGFSRANIAELYLYQEIRIWMSRMAGCALIGLLVGLSVSRLGPDGARTAIRTVIALAAPLSLIEFLFLRGFARRAARPEEATRR